jgi:hypothetical protein
LIGRFVTLEDPAGLLGGPPRRFRRCGVIDGSWQQVYGARIDDLHLPASQAGQQDLMVRYGTDGYFLLGQVHGPGAPAWLRELPAVQELRRIWIQQFCREVSGGRQEVRRREKLPEGDARRPHLTGRSTREWTRTGPLELPRRCPLAWTRGEPDAV